MDYAVFPNSFFNSLHFLLILIVPAICPKIEGNLEGFKLIILKLSVLKFLSKSNVTIIPLKSFFALLAISYTYLEAPPFY